MHPDFVKIVMRHDLVYLDWQMVGLECYMFVGELNNHVVVTSGYGPLRYTFMTLHTKTETVGERPQVIEYQDVF